MRFRPSSTFMLLLVVFGLVACDASGYRKVGGQWTHGDTPVTPQDPATFKPIDDRFARDAVRGYYRGSVLPESDGASFAVVSENEARDRKHVYYCDTYRKGQEYWSIQHLRMSRIAGADPATYTSIGKGHARDKHRVYAAGVPFKVRDPASFEPLDGEFARDAQRGYHARAEIPGSHGPSFEIIDARDTAYARDRASAYYGHRAIDSEANVRPRGAVQTLRDAQPAALRVLGRDYAADGRHVWHRGRLIAGADAATFTIDESYRGNADATDKSGAWQYGQRVAATK